MQAHTRGCFWAILMDENGNVLHEENGYVPERIPGGRGDDVVIEIDNETGKILNWESINDYVL